MSKKFNRSQFMRERHDSANKQQKLYEDLTGKKADHNTFMRKDNPISNRIVAYDVSYQLSYYDGVSNKPGLTIEKGETFTVYVLDSNTMSEEKIIANTQDAVRSAKSSIGNGFSIPTQDKAMTDSNFKVNTSKVRGMENVDIDLSEKVINGLSSGKGFYVDSKDTEFTAKNKKGTTAKMKADLSDYFNN